MMFWVIGYIALVAYGAGLFTWAVTHGREGAAVGILLSISGFQLAIMETLDPSVGIGIAISGLLIVGRDVVIALRRGAQFAPAFARSSGDHGDELA